MKTFNRNQKAISPIFATLILIAIAVIAGVVVYMFTNGALATMQNGGTAAQEKMSVQSAQYNSGTMTLLVQNTGADNGVATGIIIKNSAGNTVTSITGTSLTANTLTAGSLNTITGTTTLNTGTYTATLTTQKGGSFVSSTFTV